MGIIITLLSFNVVIFLLWDNARRVKKINSLSLRANCLISPHPFVFLNGKKSIFYFMAYWGDLPSYLAEHGYEIFHLNLPWKSDHQQTQQLQKFLLEKEQCGEAIHLIADASSKDILERLFRERHYSAVKTCLIIEGKSNSGLKKASLQELKPLQNIMRHLKFESLPPSWIWRLHQWRTRQNSSLDLRQALDFTHNKVAFDHVLDQVIAISEIDFYSLDSTIGETTHDEFSERFARDFSRSKELS